MPGGGYAKQEAVSNSLQIDVVDVVAEGLRKQSRDLARRVTLDFSKTWVTDNAALQYLDGLTELKELRLFSAENITDAGLERLKRLPALERLDVAETRVSDAGLERFQTV